MGASYKHNDISINLEKKGLDRYTKTSYPQRYGLYSEIETRDAIYQFNLCGEIIFAKGKGDDWPDRQEWLKRSVGNDWVYYSTGGYTGVFEALGEFYLPNLQYPTNSLLGGKPFSLSSVEKIIHGWHNDLEDIGSRLNGTHQDVKNYIRSILANSPQLLQEKAERLFNISGGRVSVLPPDSRHVDYNLIPVTIAQGCLYKCRFCKVKNAQSFKEKKKTEIDLQIKELVNLYGKNLKNYNSVFFGEHDSLCASKDLILYSIQRTYEEFGFAGSIMRGANYFAFGSVDSFLNAEERLFEELRKFPADFYINLGLESADQETLDQLGKPITEALVEEAFCRMQDVNEKYMNIEISANFIMEESLPKKHYPRFLELVRDSIQRKKPKGCVYLSPLKFGDPSRELVFEFNRLKLQSRLPTFLYIIQRL